MTDDTWPAFTGAPKLSRIVGQTHDVTRAFLVLGIGSTVARRHPDTMTQMPTPGASFYVAPLVCCASSGRQWLTLAGSPVAELPRIDALGRELAARITRPVPPLAAFYVQLVAGTLLIFGLRSRPESAPGPRAEAQEAVAAALQARRAILECTDDNDWKPTVAAFSQTYLGVARTDPQWLEAVSTALLGNWIDVLDMQPPDGDSTLHHLRREAQTVHRQLTPLWERKTGPGRVWMLDHRLPSGEALHELVAGSYQIDDEALAWYPDRRDACAVFDRLKEDEQHVARAFALGGGSWSEAAAATGLPAQVGERVMRKLRRLGLQHQGRRAAVAGSA
ncbi:hypothetical protein [Streptomyces nojiriensis]|uniref:hypothetical protein n=1 Tax=Streptomyces nojiriensis TaxID=66374 RepID=UPI001AD6DC90|nr:hypothetical protein [Streptomyces nojiriensis]